MAKPKKPKCPFGKTKAGKCRKSPKPRKGGAKKSGKAPGCGTWTVCNKRRTLCRNKSTGRITSNRPA